MIIAGHESGMDTASILVTALTIAREQSLKQVCPGLNGRINRLGVPPFQVR